MEPKMAFPRGLTGANAAYCPLFFRTWSQAVLILARCSLRQARMVKSPWSMTGRQNFWTSRVQAFCSSAVPLRDCCWAKAPDEAASDNRVSARRNLRIVFLHFGGKKSCSRFALRHCRNGFVWMGRRRVTQRRVQDKHGKCGQIYGDLSTLNNRLIFNVYFCHTRYANWLLQTMRRIARCCADGAGVNGCFCSPACGFFPAATAGNKSRHLNLRYCGNTKSS